MAWCLNHHVCYRCDRHWTDEWSCMCDDECPHCGARDSTPVDSEDLTEMIVGEGDEFIVLRSPDTAEENPDYEKIGRFSTREGAEAFLAAYDPDELVVLNSGAPRLD